MSSAEVEAAIAAAYERGVYVEGCRGCEAQAAEWREIQSSGPPMGPSHRASDACESGKMPHCTCDWCF